MTKTVITSKFIACFLAFMVLSACTGVFLHPSKQFYPVEYLKGIKKTEIFFSNSRGNMLHAWLLEPEQKPKGLILFLHGNAENLRTHTMRTLFFVKAGYSVFSFDYSGYGLSQGEATIDNIHLDSEAALSIALRYAPDGKVVVFGQSLGAAVAIYLVATSEFKDRVKALIVDSAFCGYRKIVKDKLNVFFLTSIIKGALAMLIKDIYSPERYINKIAVPMVFIHCLQDRVVPPYHSLLLYEKAVSSLKQLWFVNDCGHINALLKPELQQRLLQFLTHVQ